MPEVPPASSCTDAAWSAELPAEFAFIARHFRKLAGPGALDLLDDAALLIPTPGTELVLAADAIIENVHFLADDPPGDIGRKLLRVNLSDLAAMGAAPRGYLMTVAVPPGRDDAFFAAFAAGLAADQAAFGIALLGGDTTGTAGPLALSLTVVGEVPQGQAVRRGGAAPGDLLFVTGTIGDGALGLRALRGEVPDPDGHLADRYRRPRPRLGFPLRGLATSAIDVSDGLLQDAGHLARASSAAVAIERDLVPLSPAARACGPAWLETCLTGGDDYELLFTVPAASAAVLEAAARAAGVPVTRIGRVAHGPARVTLLDERGAKLPIRRAGYSHF